MRDTIWLRARLSNCGVLLGLLSAVIVTGCSAPIEDEGAEGVAKGSEALLDATGTIHTTIKLCAGVNYSTGQHVGFCDFGRVNTWNVPVLIGGGAEIDGEPKPGALLVDSYPIDVAGDYRTWRFAAKDHVDRSAYRLAGAAIGLQIEGLDARVLQTLIHTTFADSSPSEHFNVATAIAPTGDVVLGGGAGCTSASGVNLQLLVGSRPFPDTNGSTPTGWKAVCSDHATSSIGYASAFVVSMPRCIDGLCYSSTTSTWSVPVVSTGYNYLYMNSGKSKAVTGVGGYTTNRGAGRFLTMIWPDEYIVSTPTSGGLEVDAKDHTHTGSGQTFGYMIKLSRI